MNGTPPPLPPQLAHREWRRVLSPFALFIIVIAAAILTIGGPFDTLHSLDTGRRAAYWLIACLMASLVARGLAILLHPHLIRRIPHPLLRMAAIALLLALPTSSVVLGVNALFFGWQSPAMTLRMLIEGALLTIAVVLVVGVSRQRMDGRAAAAPRRAVDQDTAEIAASPARPPLLERLPPDRRGALYALSAEDHYVAVRTERGHALVLMRLADAMREAAPTPGLRIHRSHWVALAAVRCLRGRAGGGTVELQDGTVLPVSRGFIEAARQAGLPTA